MSICCIIGCKSKEKKIKNVIDNIIIPCNLVNDSRYICNNHYKYYRYLGIKCDLCDGKARYTINNNNICNVCYGRRKYKNIFCSIEDCRKKSIGDKVDGEYMCKYHKQKYLYKNTECSIHGCHNKMAMYKNLHIATDHIKKKNSGYMCNKHRNKYNINIIKYLKKKLNK